MHPHLPPPPAQYAVGDRVDVRDKPTADWRPAVVKTTTPRLTALVEGWTVAYKWEQTRPREPLRTPPPRTAEEEAAQEKLAAELQSQLESLTEGDRVEVKDEEAQEWRAGTVTSVKPLMVKVDGWKKAHMWQFARRIAEGTEAENGKDAAATAAAGGSAAKGATEKKTQEAPVHIVLTAVWEHVCLWERKNTRIFFCRNTRYHTATVGRSMPESNLRALRRANTERRPVRVGADVQQRQRLCVGRSGDASVPPQPEARRQRVAGTGHARAGVPP